MITLLELTEETIWGIQANSLKKAVSKEYRSPLLRAFTMYLVVDIQRILGMRLLLQSAQISMSKFIEKYKKADEKEIPAIIGQLPDKYMASLQVNEQDTKWVVQSEPFAVCPDLSSEELLLQLEFGNEGIAPVEIRTPIKAWVITHINEKWDEFRKEYEDAIDELMLQSIRGT